MTDTINVHVNKHNQVLQLQQDQSLAPEQCHLLIHRRNGVVGVAIPPSVNPLTGCEFDGDDVIVTTMHPHGLFVQQGVKHVPAPDRHGICIAPGQTMIAGLILQYKSDRQFVIRGPIERNVASNMRAAASFLWASKAHTLQSTVASVADRLPEDISLTCQDSNITLFDRHAWLPSALKGGILQVLPLGVSSITPGKASVCINQTAFCSNVAIRPSTYTIETLCRAVSNALNHIHVSAASDLTFEDFNQSKHIEVKIDSGLYTLATLAAVINEQLQSQGSDIRSSVIERNRHVLSSNGLCFRSITPFGIRFANFDMADKLGYSMLNLRGKTSYTPNTKGLATLGGVSTNKLILLSCNNVDQHIDITVSLPEPVAIKIGTFADGKCTITTETPHVFAERDVVRIGANVYRVCSVWPRQLQVAANLAPKGQYVMFANLPEHVSVARSKNLVDEDVSLHVDDIVAQNHQSM